MTAKRLLLDGSDEFRCPAVCDLDSVTDQEAFKELCGWSQTRSGTRYATWILISGSHASKYFQMHPLIDASARTMQGKYLILNLVDLPHLPSVHLNIDSGEPNEASKGLSVLWKSSGSPSTLLTPAKQSEWKNGSAYIGKQTNPFFLTFSRSAAPFSSQGTVALDNLQFNAC
uniref:MAM domain-containing protein n=1 Tax=Tetranychus urticae TaxID=32264 RepID=T1KXE4_TETUR